MFYKICGDTYIALICKFDSLWRNDLYLAIFEYFPPYLFLLFCHGIYWPIIISHLADGYQPTG